MEHEPAVGPLDRPAFRDRGEAPGPGPASRDLHPVAVTASLLSRPETAALLPAAERVRVVQELTRDDEVATRVTSRLLQRPRVQAFRTVGGPLPAVAARVDRGVLDGHPPLSLSFIYQDRPGFPMALRLSGRLVVLPTS
ncbi:DUF6192 family protein [Streptomyces sp. NPDC056519]|uniref:DUF6192 family protein n=1 Tax=Streptomyces sp. NPDC056519 TaxID=3345849 RepID=UPI003685B4B3